MITFNKTIIMPEFDSGCYIGTFKISNEYLNSFWFDCHEPIWDIVSVKIALIIEKEIKEKMKNKMNKESYKERFDSKKNTEAKV